MAMASDHQHISVMHDIDLLECNIQQETIDCSALKSKLSVNHNLINIIHLNIRSINKNFNEFLLFLEAYKINYCDVIVLSETWNINDAIYDIPGYNMHYNYANYNKNDGVVVYTKSDLNCKFVDTKLITSGVTLTRIELILENVRFGVICVYRPPSTHVQSFLEDIGTYLTESQLSQIDILVGDVNINLCDQNDVTVGSYVSLLHHFGFLSAVNNPTRVYNNTGSCLDHIFIRKKLKTGSLKYSTFILNTDITDHFPIMLNINRDLIANRPTGCGFVTHTSCDINYHLAGELLKNQNWTSVMDADDSETALQMFYELFLGIVEQAKIYKTYTIKNYNRLKPWMTNGIICSIKARDKMKKKLLLHFNDHDNNQYKEYRNNLKKIIEKCKYNYFKNKIENNNKNLKNIYKIIAEATDDKISTSKTDLEIKNNNMIFPNKKEMANFCNEYFTNVGMEMYQNIKNPTNNVVNAAWSTMSSMYLKPVNQNEIIKQIHSLKNNCASGEDGIHTKLIKLLHPYLKKTFNSYNKFDI